ncbi:MAG: hypothetical protein OSB10_00520 [Planctomycetota bacterium]|nr:hypothetical protein [Planctomycetota bacterium]
MNTSPLLIGASLLATGLIGGATAHLFMPAPVIQNSAAGVGISPSGPTNIAEQLNSLAQATESLQKRLSMLESSASGSDRIAIAGDGLAAPMPADPEILAAVEAYMAKASAKPGSVRDIVASTLTDIRTQEDVQREQEREDAKLNALQARINRLTEDLGLYPDQATKMFTALNNEQVRRDELKEEMRNGTGDKESARDSMRDLKDETTFELEQFLTAEQIESYNGSNTGGGKGGRRGGTFGGNAGGGKGN